LKRKNLVLLIFIALLLGFTLITGGCGTTAQKPIENVPAPAPTTPTSETPEGTTNAPAYNTELANRIADEAGKVNGVTKANVLIADTNIYIGLDLLPNLNKTKSNAIEKTVTDKVKAMQPNYSVVVSSDTDMVTRINNVTNGIAQGTPISTFKNEIEIIGNRLNPQKQ
jgi:YhcN/YlaJ family sporulation lipoprotein